jgi:hypothetical protein
MMTLYRFGAYNTEAVYGWGAENEADKYCDFLNRKREINVYGFEEVTDANEIATRDEQGDGVNLADALIEIAENDAENHD